MAKMIVEKNLRIERISPQENSSSLSQKKSPVDFFGIICGLYEKNSGNCSRNVQVSSNLLARREA